LPRGWAILPKPGATRAPNLAKKGIAAKRYVNADITMTYFNMEDPVIGGYTPEKVALRRAISLGVDVDREIRLIRRNQAIPAQSPIAPNTYGYDPDLKTEDSDYDPARAKALLDMYGYTDRDGDGWRDLPDGKPLVLKIATQSQQVDRQFNEMWKKNMDAIGIRVQFMPAQWPENLKASRAGKLMVWSLGSSSTAPDGQGALEGYYGPSAGSGNLARFKLEAFDEIYRKMLFMPDGPERLALFRQASKIAVAYMPYKIHVHRILTDLNQPWVLGFRRAIFWQQLWQFVDVAPPGGVAAAPQGGQ
jgi:ABC-type transport system substrate-binding protein